MEYTILDEEFFKVLNKDTGTLIMFGRLEVDQVLSTIHTVIFITEEEYNELASSEETSVYMRPSNKTK